MVAVWGRERKKKKRCAREGTLDLSLHIKGFLPCKSYDSRLCMTHWLGYWACARAVVAVQLYRLRGRILGMLENRVYRRDTTDCYQPLHHECVLLCVCVNLPP